MTLQLANMQRPTPQTRLITLDLTAEDVLIAGHVLGLFIDEQLARLRNDIDSLTVTAVETLRMRVEMATRLRGKLPLYIEHGEPDADEQ